jgi:hypothetical protein
MRASLVMGRKKDFKYCFNWQTFKNSFSIECATKTLEKEKERRQSERRERNGNRKKDRKIAR